MEDCSAKSVGKLAKLFGQETGSTSQSLAPFLASCRELESLHSDLHKVLTSVEAKRATETLTATDDACEL
jgi:hypothetical protein